jgi:GTP cyclohydrolase I (EC 3.5.4.16)
MAFRNSTNGYHTDHALADDDGQEYETLIVQGRGKLEGVSYHSDPAIEDAVRVILKQIGETPNVKGC